MAKYRGPRRPPASKKPALTHFLCLPLVTESSRPQLEASLNRFRDDVTGRGPTGDDTTVGEKDDENSDEPVSTLVHPKAIRPVGALHCTLGVMSLTQDELVKAESLLNELDVKYLLQETTEAGTAKGADPDKQTTEGVASLERPISPPRTKHPTSPLTIDLKCIESMHDPRKTSILYVAPTDKSGRLYNCCLALQKTFKDSGLLVEDNRELKLHATIVNTIYAKSRKRLQRKQPGSSLDTGPTADAGSYGHGPNANAPLKIDATQLLGKYKDYVWAENVVLDRVAICEMGAKKIFDDAGNLKAEEYTEVASIRLPG